MFKLDVTNNKIVKMEVTQFSKLGFKERQNLQEWVAENPQSLGEDLLIIQKEFAGFDDTNERLDLLALDKDGMLVVIENKLDDSGKDVVWQAMKYAAYCSTMKTEQVVAIFQEYLNKTNAGDAQTIICGFLGITDATELKLNTGNDQRIILVAANFRKEVTSTAIWMLAHGINIQLIKVVPHVYNDDIFLNIDQIIPPPEAKDYMIGIVDKERSEKNVENEMKTRHVLRMEYWNKTIEEFRKSSCRLFDNRSPSRDHWLSGGSGTSGIGYQLIFSIREARVELEISRSSKEENKYIFDKLYKNKDKIESDFQAQLDWNRGDDSRRSMISYSKNFDGYNKACWDEMIEWMISHMLRFEKAFAPQLKPIVNKLKLQGIENVSDS